MPSPTLLFLCLLPLSLACVKAETQKDAAPAADAARDVTSPPAPTPDAPPADAPPEPDGPIADAAPLPADAAPDRAPDVTPADGAPDLPPSPCPGGPAPADYNLTCGCQGDGKVQCDGTCNKPDGTCVPTGQFYVLTNTFLGEMRRLDTYSSTNAEAFMARTLGASGQFWNVTSLGGGAYRLTNMFLGAARSLEAAADGNKLFMGTTGDSPAQKWRIRAVGPGLFRIQNAASDGKSLDTHNDATNDPWLGTTGNYTGQSWKLTKAP